MTDDVGCFDVMVAVKNVTPAAFACKVDRFQAIVTNPAVPMAEKARAWDAIVRDAAQLDSTDIGFPRAGVALKQALRLWLDVRSDLTSTDEELRDKTKIPSARQKGLR